MRRTDVIGNGTIKLPGGHRESSSVIYVAGVFGAAVAKLVTSNGDGTFSDLENGTITGTDTHYYIEHGLGIDVYVNITNADGATALLFTNAGIN